MPYRIVAYDIPSDRLRATIAQTLIDYGLERVQYSVFTGNLTTNLTEELTIALRDQIKTKQADVRIFTICTHLKDPQIIVSELPPDARGWPREDKRSKDHLAALLAPANLISLNLIKKSS
ncbi:MAG: CRISPR-associated endonuclease Cas2 [Candidatus Bathyarchaeia archaeon]